MIKSTSLGKSDCLFRRRVEQSSNPRLPHTRSGMAAHACDPRLGVETSDTENSPEQQTWNGERPPQWKTLFLPGQQGREQQRKTVSSRAVA